MATAAKNAEARAPVRTGRGRALVVVGAVAAGLATWVLAGPVAGVELAAGTGTGPQSVGPIAVALVSLVAGLAGTGLLAVLERVTRRAAGVWLGVALAVLLVSLAGPLGGTTAGAMIALACMHIAVGLTLALGLWHTARGR